ncbi:uncharacterized protein LOC144547470 [Carex rostrata]
MSECLISFLFPLYLRFRALSSSHCCFHQDKRLQTIEKEHRKKNRERVIQVTVMTCGLTLYFMNHVLGFLHGWVSSCLSIADEIARAIRRGDIGPFPVG